MSRLLTVLAFSMPLAAHAVTTVPDVVVSAARTEQSLLTTPASIRVITREQIAASGARHVVEVLRGQGGIQVSDAYGDGSRSTIGMRGFGETANANTLILLDGRRLNNPDIASPDLNSIPLDNIQRIEIVQGSAGVLFGDQAVGGVINIITDTPAGPHREVRVSAGSYNSLKLHGSSSERFDSGFSYRVSADAHSSDNYREHNEARYYNLSGRIGQETESGSMFAEYRYINDELNTPGTLFSDEVAVDRRQVSPNFANDFSDLITRSGRVGVEQSLNDAWTAEGELTMRSTDGVFRLSSVFGAETQDAFQQREVYEFTPRVIGVLPVLNNALVTLGADFISSDYRLESRFGEQSNDQLQQSFYVQAVVPAASDLDVTIGYRHASVTNDLRDDFTFTSGQRVTASVNVGELGFAWRASDSTRWLLRADQNYRFAKVDEYTNAQPFPPPPGIVVLDTQTGLSLEGGVEWSGETGRAKLLLFRLDLENEIAYDPSRYVNVNLDQTRRQGVIGELRFSPAARLSLAASYTYTDAAVVSGPLQGGEVPFVPRHTGQLSADYRATERWQLYGEVVGTGERYLSGDFGNLLQKLPGYAIVNVKTEYAFRDIALTARINNLFNREYSEVGQLGTDPGTFAPRAAYFPSPEINFMLTAALRFR